MFTSRLTLFLFCSLACVTCASWLYYQHITINKLQTELTIAVKANQQLTLSAKVNDTMINELNDLVNSLRDDNTQFQHELAAINDNNSSKTYLNCTIPTDVRELLRKPTSKSSH